MAISRTVTFILILIIFTVFNSCFQEDESTQFDNISKEININDWIWEELNTYYFWKDFLIDTDQSESDHETYFKSLLYEDDRFSWISEDVETLLEELDGEILALGFSPTFGVFSNSNNIFIIVEYVYPESSAEEAGLARGDIILKIDGLNLTMDNYLDLYDKTEYTVTLGAYNENGIYETDQEIFITNSSIDINPVVYTEIKDIDNIKIGYIVYVDFLAGENDSKLDNLGHVIDEMKAQGITELIFDLRYNRGGNVEAVKYLGSILAPYKNVLNQDVFVKFDYNDVLEDYYLAKEGENSEHLFIRFSDNGHNLDLDRIVILTGSNTASASELLLVGLDPYMQIISIGEPTFGKFYGSFVIYDTNDPRKHNWAMIPVVLKYTNANGFTDFEYGITPDFYIEDNLLEAKPFGDEADPMLSKALSYIIGKDWDEGARIDRSKLYRELPDWYKIKKGNILYIQDFSSTLSSDPISILKLHLP